MESVNPRCFVGIVELVECVEELKKEKEKRSQMMNDCVMLI